MIETEENRPGLIRLKIDGELLDGDYHITHLPGNKISVMMMDRKSLGELSEMSLSSLASAIGVIGGWECELQIGLLEVDPSINFSDSYHQIRSIENIATIRLNSICDVVNWKQLWSPAEYVEEFIRIWHQNKASIFCERTEPELEESDEEKGVSIYIFVNIDERLLDDVFQLALRDVKKIDALTVASLAAKLHAGAVVAQFHFPAEVAVPCEQYLLYFVQFLRDAGVGAIANLEHDAGNVLFSVTPDSQDVALDKIYEALAVYLQLPTNPGIGGGMIGVGDVQGQQLMANVTHLQGQLMLANAVLQAKDVTIQTQQITIAQLRQPLGGEVLFNSLQRVDGGEEKAKDKEELLGGAVALTKYEGKGYEVNIPQIYRYFRDLFAKK